MREIIYIVETALLDDDAISIEQQFHMLYHGTSSKHVKDIIAVGLSAPNHWGSLDIARYFAKAECKESGGRPVIIAKPISEFSQARFQADDQMIDFPVLTDICGADHGAMEDEWEESEQGWEDCLRIYESVVYNAPVAVSRNDITRSPVWPLRHGAG